MPFRQSTLTSVHSSEAPENEMEALLTAPELKTETETVDEADEADNETPLKFCNWNGFILLIIVLVVFFVVGLMFMYNQDQFPNRYSPEYPQELVLKALIN